MKKILFCISVVFSTFFCFAQNNFKNDSLFIRKMFEETMTNAKCYENLRILCTQAGPRISGSPEAEIAVELTKVFMTEAGSDSVFLQKVMVPKWVRGKRETARIMLPSKKSQPGVIEPVMQNIFDVPVCALGGSVATPEEGLKCNVIEVGSKQEFEKLTSQDVKGKFVFFNVPMNPKVARSFEAYGPAVFFRGNGAILAASKGAAGVIIRSVTHSLDDFPHTGAMKYVDSLPKIPACAISTKAADLLSRMLKTNAQLEFELKMNCKLYDDVPSSNVVGVLKGKENKDEIIVCGGHLDAWDLGEGAHDDGAGCVQTIEALRILKAVGYKPKRTLRFVMFMNEENGLRGGKEYARLSKENNEKHIAAIESDAGGFAPDGFSSDLTIKQKEGMQNLYKLLKSYGMHDFDQKGGGADISPLEDQGVAMFGLMPESQRYFDYHHAASDTFDKVNKRELEMGAFAMATLIYYLSEYGIQPK